MKRLSLIFIALFLIEGPVFSQKREPGKVKTVVIDPGHGGDKPGAIGKHCKEKDIVLNISHKFGKLIADNYPDVTIIYTHEYDADITLAERAHIANRAKADLFISIHANSHPTAVPSGVETFVMGLSQSKANMEVAKKENADILLESGYKDNSDYAGFDPNSPESYVMFAMYQNANLNKSLNFAQYIQTQYKTNLRTIDRGVKQAELFVLYKTTMPAVLTEVGFISNPDEEAFLLSDEGQAKIAVSLFNAFATYKAAEEGTKRPTNPVIDLPGYGKNKTAEKSPTAEDLAAADLADSIARADSLAHVAMVADSIKAAAAEAARVEDSIKAAQEAAQPKKREITYRVQFLSSEKILEPDAKELRGVTDFEYYQQGRVYRYTKGNVRTIRDAKDIQNELREKGFKDAFVIAFYGKRRISIQEAQEILAEQEAQKNAGK